jgi:hypothetical protein
MAINDYRFITLWNIDGTIEEAAEVLEDIEGLTQWWPSVYLSMVLLDPGGKKGIGKTVRFLTRGWLPYSLDWTLRVVESESPHRFVIEAEGDFVGRGIWRLTQVGNRAEIVYDWEVRADKPLLKFLSCVLKPLFGANHRWAVSERWVGIHWRRARRAGQLERICRPPGPALYSGPLLAVGAVLLLLMIAKAKRRPSPVREEDEG